MVELAQQEPRLLGRLLALADVDARAHHDQWPAFSIALIHAPAHGQPPACACYPCLGIVVYPIAQAGIYPRLYRSTVAHMGCFVHLVDVDRTSFGQVVHSSEG